jgi:hypothetical protein
MAKRLLIVWVICRVHITSRLPKNSTAKLLVALAALDTIVRFLALQMTGVQELVKNL